MVGVVLGARVSVGVLQRTAQPAFAWQRVVQSRNIGNRWMATGKSQGVEIEILKPGNGTMPKSGDKVRLRGLCRISALQSIICYVLSIVEHASLRFWRLGRGMGRFGPSGWPDKRQIIGCAAV